MLRNFHGGQGRGRESEPGKLSKGFPNLKSGVDTQFLLTFYWTELVTRNADFWGWRLYHSYTQGRVARLGIYIKFKFN